MAKITWDAVGERRFEAGVDQGVLYPKDGPGVPWNGLVNVTESPTGGDADPYYLDGIKYYNDAKQEEFAATIEAYTYPKEFEKIDGSSSSDNGLVYYQQLRESFGLSYRTRLGNDVDGVDYGYKIHLIYNALSAPTSVTNATLDDGADNISTLSWAITTIPEKTSSNMATAHFSFDSTTSDLASIIKLEEILYGSKNKEPRLPSPSEVITIFDDWARLEIIPAPATGLVSLKYHGRPDLKGDGYVGLYEAPKDSRLVETSIPGLYTLENNESV